MSGALILTLCALAGVTGYAALHRAVVGLQQPVSRTHLLFSCMSAVVTLYVIAKIVGYRADSAGELVSARRLEVAAAIVIGGLMPWFVSAYLGTRRRVVEITTSLFCAVFFLLTLVLPFGLVFSAMPSLTRITFPWGETLTDIRVHDRTTVFAIGISGMFVSYAWGIVPALRQYSAGKDQRASLVLASSLGLPAFGLLYNQLVNLKVLPGIHIAEFCFIGLVVALDLELSRKLHHR